METRTLTNVGSTVPVEAYGKPLIAEQFHPPGSIVRALATRLPVDQEYSTHPVLTAPMTPRAVAESGGTILTDPAYVGVELVASKFLIDAAVTEEYLADAGDVFKNAHRAACRNAVDHWLDTLAFGSDLTAPYGGIRGLPYEVENGGLQVPLSGDFTGLNIDALAACMGSLDACHQRGAAWFVAPGVLPDVLGLATVGQPKHPLAAASLLGRDVFITHDNDTASTDSGRCGIVYADLKHCLFYGVMVDDDFEVLSEYDPSNGLVLLRYRARIAMQATGPAFAGIVSA